MVDIAPRPLSLSSLRRVRVTAAVALAASTSLLATAPRAVAGDGAPSCAGSHTQITQAPAGEMRSAVFCLINEQRTARGLPKLVASEKLDRSAQGWTDSMVEAGEFSHGSAFTNRISATGFDWTTVGENIATGYETPSSVVRAWMRSPGHCANILDPAYREVGTGVSARRIPRASTALGTWTQDFGRLMGQPALSGNYGPANACYH